MPEADCEVADGLGVDVAEAALGVGVGVWLGDTLLCEV